MITEHASIRCVQRDEPGNLYTQALVEHWFSREAMEGTVEVTVAYPDGTVERFDESSPRVDTRSFTLAYSGAPHTGNGDGMADVEIRYEPADPGFEPLRAYTCWGGCEPPEAPALVLDLANDELRFHDGERSTVLADTGTWGVMRQFMTWADV